jgi:hypothetical protein
MSNLDPKYAKDDDSESIGSDESEDMIGNFKLISQVKKFHKLLIDNKLTEVDEDEFDRRRIACTNDMKELENLFSKLKEALINEKQILIEQKLKEIDEETAEEFTIPLQKLKQNMEIKIKLACKFTKLSFLCY